MATKKEETAPVVEDTQEEAQVTETVEVDAEATTEPQTTDTPNPNKQTQVAGAVDLRNADMTPVNICVECNWMGPTNKGVASCPACGGKTKSGFKYQAAAFRAQDNARFNGQSAKDFAGKKDE